MRPVLLALFFASAAWAQPLVELGVVQREADLDGHLAALADPEGRLGIDDVRNAEGFTAVSPVLTREQQTPAAVWLRFAVRAPDGPPTAWALETLAERVEVYWVDSDGRVERHVAGIDVAKQEREVQRGYPAVVPLLIERGETRTIWARLLHDPDGSETTTTLRALRLRTAEASAQAARARGVWNGLFLGVLLALALYNLSLYAGFRDASVLYYVGYVVGIAVYFASTYRYLFDALWPAHLPWSPGLQTVAIHVAAVCYPLFVRRFLRPDRVGGRLSRALGGGAVMVGLGPVVILAAGWRIGSVWSSVWVLVLLALSVAAMARAWRGGFRPAGILLAAFAVLSVSTAGYLAPQFGLPPFDGSREALQLGIAIEALLLAVALTVRIRALQTARSEAETVRRRAEADRQRIEDTNAALREALSLRSSLLGIAAHDLRSPLSGILGFADRIEDEAQHPPEIAGYAAHVRTSAARMLRLIDDLLVTAALDGGHLRVELEPVDLGALVRSAALPFEAEAAGKGQRLRVQTTPGCHVLADPDRLRVVLDNLLSNAIKFTPPGGLVEVEVRATRREAWVCVADSGPGLSESDRAGLFRPFTRLSAQPTAGEASTGLGLSIVRRIVDLHGGRIEVDSEPGRGARFLVVLDAVRPSGTPRPIRPEALPAPT